MLVIAGCLGLGPAQPALDWDAPRECPQAAQVTAQLQQLLAHSSARVPVAAAAQVERVRGHAYRLTLRMSIGAHRAERTLDAESCAELAATAAWLIAVAIDPSVQRSAPVAAQEPAEASGLAPAPAEAQTADGASQGQTPGGTSARLPASGQVSQVREDAPRARPDAAGRPWVGRAAAVAGVSFGTAGAAQGELGAAAGLGLGWLYSELGLSVLLPRSEHLEGGGVVKSWSLVFGLRECALWGARLRWGPCLTLDAVRTLGHAEGLASSQTDRALFWALAGAALRGAWHLRERLELTWSGGVGLPISPRPHFTVAGVGDVAAVSALTGYARIGVGFVTR